MLPNLIAEITLDDLVLLNKFRIERLRSIFAECLLPCTMYVNSQNVLTINCPEPWIVSSLLINIEEFCDYVWLILGVKAISMYCDRQLTYVKVSN
ncbi:hypothetical protein V2H45_14910 [Tumidithrix elongata RA019]|uniref:Uncharacterized protein n=1 Tax=Tumidithrix elongata BACA0141 TaxID=2716417 RepID=A0AAW9PSL1_9CYAN|nr:hypothetical protein [Tumidithrix elongata RA019]